MLGKNRYKERNQLGNTPKLPKHPGKVAQMLLEDIGKGKEKA